MSRPPEAAPARRGLLEAFARELRTVREIYGSPSFRVMADRITHVRGAAGSRNSFNRMVLRPAVPPSPEMLRGFVLALGAPEEVAADWEGRRRALVAELSREAAQASAVHPARAGTGRRDPVLAAAAAVLCLAGYLAGRRAAGRAFLA